MCDTDFTAWLIDHTDTLEVTVAPDGTTVRVHQYSQDDHAARLEEHRHDPVTGYTPRPDVWYVTTDPITGLPRGSAPFLELDDALDRAASLAAGKDTGQAA